MIPVLDDLISYVLFKFCCQKEVNAYDIETDLKFLEIARNVSQRWRRIIAKNFLVHYIIPHSLSFETIRALHSDIPNTCVVFNNQKFKIFNINYKFRNVFKVVDLDMDSPRYAYGDYSVDFSYKMTTLNRFKEKYKKRKRKKKANINLFIKSDLEHPLYKIKNSGENNISDQNIDIIRWSQNGRDLESVEGWRKQIANHLAKNIIWYLMASAYSDR